MVSINLIFDGLDKLAVPETAGAQRIAEIFWDELDDLLSQLNTESKTRAIAIITGRDAIVQAALSSRGGRRLPSLDALAVNGLHALNRDAFETFDDVSTDDQRPLWWQLYAGAIGANKEVPPVLSENTLGSLTDEPLLCYLLALSGKADESRQRNIDNPNEIYQKLISDIWSRVWGPEPIQLATQTDEQRVLLRQKGPIAAFRDQDSFEQLIEYIAIAAWRGGENRIATLESFDAAVRHTPAEDIWIRFQEDFNSVSSEESFTTLALTFFFRKQDLADRGFEFTHRTFGEYLVARCLVRHVDESVERFANARSVNELADWLNLCGAAELTPTSIDFLMNEMRLKSAEGLRGLRTALAHIFKLSLRDGMPVRAGDQETWRSAEVRQRNAEGALLACVSAASIALMEKDKGASALDIGFMDPNISSRDLLERLNITGFNSTAFRQCLGGIDFRSSTNLDHLHMFLLNTSWRYSDLSGTFCFGSFLAGADLSDVNLTEADLSRSNLIGAKLCRANLTEASLTGARLYHADFSGANLNQANLANADLSESTGLVQSQINAANGNRTTELPDGLDFPDEWLDEANLEEI